MLHLKFVLLFCCCFSIASCVIRFTPSQRIARNEPLKHVMCYQTALFGTTAEDRLQDCLKCAEETSISDQRWVKCVPKPKTANEMFAANCSSSLLHFERCWSCLRQAKTVSLEQKASEAGVSLWKLCVLPGITAHMTELCHSFITVTPGLAAQAGSKKRERIRKCAACIANITQGMQSSDDITAVSSKAISCIQESLIERLEHCSVYSSNRLRNQCSRCVKNSFRSQQFFLDSFSCYNFVEESQSVRRTCESWYRYQKINKTSLSECLACVENRTDMSNKNVGNFHLHQLCVPIVFPPSISIADYALKLNKSQSSIEECYFKNRGRVLGTLEHVRQFENECLGDFETIKLRFGESICKMSKSEKHQSCTNCANNIDVQDLSITVTKLTTRIYQCAGPLMITARSQQPDAVLACGNQGVVIPGNTVGDSVTEDVETSSDLSEQQ